MIDLIKIELKNELEAALLARFNTAVNLVIEEPKRRDQGDLSIPGFVVSKALRMALPEVVKTIAEELEASTHKALIAKVQILGGFVNLFLDKKAIAQKLIADFRNPQSVYHVALPSNGKTVCIDYSSPNIAKSFSVGHLRSTIIGQAIGNLLAKLGFEVVRINHLGDFGTQFGKIIYAYLHCEDQEKVRQNPIHELSKLYVEFNEQAKVNPELDVEARRVFKELEQGNPEYVALWTWIRAISLEDYMKVYELLDVSFDSYNGEAFYNDKMQVIIDELTAKGLLVEDDGAMIVDLGETMPPALIQKSDGSTLYITRDLAAIFYRKNTYHFDQCLYVVGNEQKLHFEQIKAVLRKMGYSFADDVHHVNFGLILQDGKKMSTRKGKVVKLEDVLQEAIGLSASYIAEKNPDLENQAQIAAKIGVSAIIFNDLKNYRANDFEFDLENMVKFEGQTGPYLQYTYVRISSILNNEPFTFDGKIDAELFDDELYFEMVKQISVYQSTLEKAAGEYAPSILAKYLLNLASLFNTFYAREKIMVENVLEKNSKKHLLAMVRAILQDGMRLLGMQSIEKM
jgi:arginyl-tRNA synthetase